MKYEYKSFLLEEDDEFIQSTSGRLNDQFKQGWEYVDSISQTVSTGSTYAAYGGVLVILRKEKTEVKL